MAPSRLWLIGLALWGVDLIAFSLFPRWRVFMDPLLLFLLFAGLMAPSRRPLWAVGLGVGLLKDLSVGSFFGAWICTFTLIGILLNRLRRLIESEDPGAVAVWTGIFSLISLLTYGTLVALADSGPFWGAGWWRFPLPILLNGILAWVGFPYLKRLLGR